MSKEGQIKNQDSRVIYNWGFLESRLISWDLRYYSLSKKVDWLTLQIGTNCWVIPQRAINSSFFHQLSIERNTSSSNWQQILNSPQFILNKIKSNQLKPITITNTIIPRATIFLITFRYISFFNLNPFFSKLLILFPYSVYWNGM